MYNRYIPSPDGSFRREIVPDPTPEIQIIEPPVQSRENRESESESEQLRQEPPKREKYEQATSAQEHQKERPNSGTGTIRRLIPSTIDTGDLLVLLILLLLLVDGDEDDYLSVILTIAAFILL